MIQYYEDGDVAVFDNLAFRRDKKTGYYLNAKTHKRLHVYVWEYYNGEVPKGYDVHHKDFNKANNEVDNLQLLTKKDHATLHGKSWNKERYENQIKILDENARPISTHTPLARRDRNILCFGAVTPQKRRTPPIYYSLLE